MVYHVYIVECNDKSYYTGITNNLERRLIEHNSSGDTKSYTYQKRPVRLVFCQEFSDANLAIAFEKQVKGWSRKKKEAIIENEWHKLPELSKNKKLRDEEDSNL